MSIADNYTDEMQKEMEKGPVLVPEGVFQAIFSSHEDFPDKNYTTLNFILQNNPGVNMTDDFTPIDGQKVSCNIFWPKPGDENEMAAGNRQTKRASKLRRAGNLLKKLRISIDPPIDYGEGYGTPVNVTIKHEQSFMDASELVERVSAINAI